MAVRVWNGGDGDWAEAAHWHDQATGAAGAPTPGDTADLGSGDASVVGAEGLDGSIYNGVALILGDAADDPATLDLQNAFLSHYFSIDAAGSATLAATGLCGVACQVIDSISGSTLSLQGGTLGSDLVIEHGGSVSVAGGTTLTLNGQVTAESGITAAVGSAVVNDAALTTLGSLVDLEGTLTGTGTINVDDASTLRLGGTVASGQTVNFGDVDGLLQLGQPNAFSGAITNFQASDQIELAGVTATAASYDAAAQTLTLTDGGTAVATLHDVQAAAGSLGVVEDSVFGGADVYYTGAATREQYQVADADRAMRSDVVRDTMTVPNSTTPITGAGEKIGIISNSFNLYGTANQDAAAGYLPANADGTSAVQVLTEGTSGDDEGREMADEIHQVAPGAELFFAAAGGSEASYEDAIQKLQQAGCTIIADDENVPSQPFYQVTGGYDAAALAAIGQGVNIFDSAGNFGQSFLEETFQPQATTLPDGAGAQAQVFDNGSSGEPITIPGNTSSRIDLQWTAPYEGNGQGAPQALALQVFDANGTPVTSATGQTAGTPVIADGVQTTDLSFALPTNADPTTYRVSVSLNGNQVSPEAFKLILSLNGGTGTGSGGLIDDAQAGQGSGDERGLQLVPAINSVGASFYGNSAAFDGTPRFNEYFTNVGPGTLYDDANGNPLPSPQSAGKLDFDAPDGVAVPDPQSANPNVPTPFYGTSAAAPNAAGVAALMLQANPNLSTADVSSLLAESAISQGLTSAQQGTGLIQADRAVQLAMQTGTDANDNLAGSAGNDVITGLTGDDTISGGSGDDVILGNQGNDLIAGNQGNDLLLGGQGDDTLFGGQGNDLVLGNQGNDVILGNQGNDALLGGYGNDLLSGGQGNDVLLGNQGDDVLLGNEGNDVLFGGQGDDTLYGGQGDDTLIGGEGNDLLYGNEGSNLFVFNPGDTNFTSETGTGDEIADFKSGIDQVQFTAGPGGTAANVGSTATATSDFASIQTAAQQLLDGGDTYAFVSDGHDGFLFTSVGNPGHAIRDAVELANVTSLKPGDIV